MAYLVQGDMSRGKELFERMYVQLLITNIVQNLLILNIIRELPYEENKMKEI
jgi:hypothetical protein